VSVLQKEKKVILKEYNEKLIAVNDSIKVLKLQRDSLKAKSQEITKVVDQKEKVIVKLQVKIANLTKSTAPLSDDELFHLANKEYGQPDTLNARRISMLRPTTEYLVETSQKFKEAEIAIDTALSIIKDQKQQLLIDSVVFVNYDRELDQKDEIITTQQETIYNLDGLYTSLDKAHKKEKIKNKVTLGLIAGVLLYGILK
jgi:hypothetical protein